jgi:SAM-dependent methyltransferase
MPTHEWLKSAFHYGYQSGEILSLMPNRRRWREERKIGGSYRRVFNTAVRPYLRANSTVLELGPGAGDWTRAILRCVPEGRVITLDYQDVSEWLDPAAYGGRLTCHQISANTFAQIADESIDFFWSFGVLCHNNVGDIEKVLLNALPKLKRGGFACHQYGDWDKLTDFGWEKGKVPTEFKTKPDEEIWWPRNARAIMSDLAKRSGWNVVAEDLGLLKRDGLILLKRV